MVSQKIDFTNCKMNRLIRRSALLTNKATLSTNKAKPSIIFTGLMIENELLKQKITYMHETSEMIVFGSIAAALVGTVSFIIGLNTNLAIGNSGQHDY